MVRAATDESQKTRNKKQNGLAHSRFIVFVTPKQKKNIAWFENQVLAEHVRKSQSTIYLKSHGCVHGFQKEVSLINFSTMFCKPCSLSRNRSLRDAKSARHMFVWFAKHCLAEHCLLFRGDADECQKQFCFVFRICLAFFDSRLWRPLASKLWDSEKDQFQVSPWKAPRNTLAMTSNVMAEDLFAYRYTRLGVQKVRIDHATPAMVITMSPPMLSLT